MLLGPFRRAVGAVLKERLGRALDLGGLGDDPELRLLRVPIKREEPKVVSQCEGIGLTVFLAHLIPPLASG